MLMPKRPEETVTLTIDKVNELMVECYMAGFMAAQQGWNGEFPFRNRRPKNSLKFRDEATANLQRVIKEVLEK